MHEHAHHVPHACRLLFQIANIVTTLGYAAVPFFVLRYLNFTRGALVFGVGFFVGCAGTHAMMGFDHVGSLTMWWVLWHVVQAVCTWGFIVKFGLDLRRARARLKAQPEVLKLLDEPGGA